MNFHYGTSEPGFYWPPERELYSKRDDRAIIIFSPVSFFLLRNVNSMPRKNKASVSNLLWIASKLSFSEIVK